MFQFSIPRLPWSSFFMLQAHLVATRSTCNRGPALLFDPKRCGVGCVLVKDKRVIASGYNGAPPGMPQCDDPKYGHMLVEGHCCRALHSEINALLQCALDGTSPEGSTIYCTAMPCWDCAKALVRSKIHRVVLGAMYDSRYDLSKKSAELLEAASIQVGMLPLSLDDFLKDGVEDAENDIG